jgi:hypothetical protein
MKLGVVVSTDASVELIEQLELSNNKSDVVAKLLKMQVPWLYGESLNAVDIARGLA